MGVVEACWQAGPTKAGTGWLVGMPSLQLLLTVTWLSACLLPQGGEDAHEAIREVIVERSPFPRLVAEVLAQLGTTK